jgi:hypothetical protein
MSKEFCIERCMSRRDTVFHVSNECMAEINFGRWPKQFNRSEFGWMGELIILAKRSTVVKAKVYPYLGNWKRSNGFVFGT